MTAFAHWWPVVDVAARINERKQIHHTHSHTHTYPHASMRNHTSCSSSQFGNVKARTYQWSIPHMICAVVGAAVGVETVDCHCRTRTYQLQAVRFVRMLSWLHAPHLRATPSSLPRRSSSFTPSVLPCVCGLPSCVPVCVGAPPPPQRACSVIVFHPSDNNNSNNTKRQNHWKQKPKHNALQSTPSTAFHVLRCEENAKCWGQKKGNNKAHRVVSMCA